MAISTQNTITIDGDLGYDLGKKAAREYLDRLLNKKGKSNPSKGNVTIKNKPNIPNLPQPPQQSQQSPQNPQDPGGSQSQQSQQGQQGSQSQQGSQGQQSQQGSQGQQGQQGSQSRQGSQGQQSQQGPQAPQSQQGSQGQGGLHGPNGSQDPIYKPIKVDKINYPKTSVCDGNYTIMDGDHVKSPEQANIILDNAGIDKSHRDMGKASNDPLWKDYQKDVDEIKNIFGNLFPDAKNPGDKLAGKILANRKPVIDWKAKLRKFLNKGKPEPEETYRKDNVSSDRLDTYIPDDPDDGKRIGKRIVIFIDTSGSVCSDENDLYQLVSEVQGVAQQCKVEWIDLYAFSDSVYNIATGDSGHIAVEIRPSTIKQKGWGILNPASGGTNYLDAFATIYDNYYKNKRAFDAIIFFTDTDILGLGQYTGNLNKVGDNINIVSNWAKKTLWCIIDGHGTSLREIYDHLPIRSKVNNIIQISKSEFYGQCTNFVTEAAIESSNKASIFRKLAGNDGIVRNKSEKPRAISAEDRRRQAVRIARESGDMRYFQPIIDWMDQYCIGSPKFMMINSDQKTLQSDNDIIYSITDDLKIKIYTTQKVEFKKYIYKKNGYTYRCIPDFIHIESINGSFVLADNSVIVEMPNNFIDTVYGAIFIENCPGLRSLKNMPKIRRQSTNSKVSQLLGQDYDYVYNYDGDGGLHIHGCPKITRKDLDDYENMSKELNTVSDTYSSPIRIDTDIPYDFNENYSIKYNHKNILNEAFSSNLLTVLYDKNKNIMSYITKQLPIAWSEIDDDLVTLYKNYGRVKDLISGSKNLNNQKNLHGIMIFTDGNDNINFVTAGNSIEKDRIWNNSNINNIINGRIELLYHIKSKFDRLNVDYKNFIRGPYSESDVDTFTTLQRFIQNLVYIYISWAYNSRSSKPKGDDIWIEGSDLESAFPQLTFESCEDIINGLSFCDIKNAYSIVYDKGHVSFNGTLYDRDKFFDKTSNGKFEKFLNPEILKTILLGANIRAKKYTDNNSQSNVFDTKTIFNISSKTELYEMISLLRNVSVRDSLLYNLQFKDNLPINKDGSITQFLQFLAVPDYISKLYYIAVKDTERYMDPASINTKKERKDNFNVKSQLEYIRLLRQNREAKLRGMPMNNLIMGKNWRELTSVKPGIHNKRYLLRDDADYKTKNFMPFNKDIADTIIGKTSSGGQLKKLCDSVSTKIDQIRHEFEKEKNARGIKLCKLTQNRIYKLNYNMKNLATKYTKYVDLIQNMPNSNEVKSILDNINSKFKLTERYVGVCKEINLLYKSIIDNDLDLYTTTITHIIRLNRKLYKVVHMIDQELNPDITRLIQMNSNVN